MKLESIDPETLSIRVGYEGGGAPDLFGKLSSLIMVAYDCGVPSILFDLPESAPPAVRAMIEEIARRNPLLTLATDGAPQATHTEFGGELIGHDWSFICFRHVGHGDRYSIFISAIDRNVDRASRCAYVIASVFGFSEELSFEIRFSVYELLNNIVEHGLAMNPQEWVQIDLEKQGDRLIISIIDKGTEFNPSGDLDFDLEAYIAQQKRRGLGLIMTRRLAEQLSYERDSGYNKVMFKKSVSSSSVAIKRGKEKTIMQFEASEPRQCRDGSYLINLRGDLDAKGSLTLERVLAVLLEKKILHVTLDFKEVQFISSSGVGILLGITSSLREAGGEVTFTRVSARVRSVFRLLNLEDYFTIGESVETSA